MLPEHDEEHVNPDVSQHWGQVYANRVRQMLEVNGTLFRSELGMFNDGITMPIPFKDENDLANLKQNPYNLSPRDQKAMNDILDPLVAQGRVTAVPLGAPSPAASPAFVV